MDDMIAVTDVFNNYLEHYLPKPLISPAERYEEELIDANDYDCKKED